ncbi:hypothetical protein RhiXN_09109 [Rhizoctonia solani]|uniref:Transmembrane protein n=1 Tax=Rhizoctonia solani TaxID=456999 RepID=A0A8H8NUJ3_9AGAM|nr:uncharacterized protein RhiXN_09109 [Rhizoctonia solani]QRW20134.1 hypothetical protein RhiXN_09109 [Rhizoctonia solani]
MMNSERAYVTEGSSNRPLNDREERPTLSDGTLVGRAEAGPLPTKQGELGYVPSSVVPPQAPNEDTNQLLQTKYHPTPKCIHSKPSILLQTVSSNAKASPNYPRRAVNNPAVVGWIVTVVRMNAWDKKGSVFAPPPQSISSEEGNKSNADAPPPDPFDQMTHSSLVFVHVAFGASVLFLLLMLERAVYRFRAERYAHLHPEEMAAATEVNREMGLSPWNRPPLPSYAAALGVRGTGDVEDNVIAAPPPPEYGNTRGSTLLLTSHHLAGSQSRSSSTSQPRDENRQDVLGRPIQDWSRPVSYAEDEMRENLRRSLDLEAALARLEGPNRPESALTRR